MDNLIMSQPTEHRHPKVRPTDAAKTFIVTVIAEITTAGDVVFSLDSRLKGSKGHLFFNKKNDNMRTADYYLIEFDLDDETDLGLKFEPNPMSAFWVKTSNDTTPPDCPNDPAHSDEIYAVSVDPNGLSLTVRNNDDYVQAFRFALNFVDEDGRPHRYDPVGQNQNSGVRSD